MSIQNQLFSVYKVLITYELITTDAEAILYYLFGNAHKN